MTPAPISGARLAETCSATNRPENYLSLPYLVNSRRGRSFSWQYKYAKRILDLIGAIVMLGVFFVPGLVIAVAILVTSSGPLFYREERIGRHGIPFRIWKFRTMYVKSELLLFRQSGTTNRDPLHWRMHKTRHDPRITKIGRFLRQWSLDELPQVFNILTGEMSLVGPRPIVRDETVKYAERLRFYLMAKPGLSGLWQVSGRCELDYRERTKLDATYIRHWSIFSDIWILCRTIPAVLGRVGAW